MNESAKFRIIKHYIKFSSYNRISLSLKSVYCKFIYKYLNIHLNVYLNVNKLINI